MGTATVHAQVVAERLGLPWSRCRCSTAIPTSRGAILAGGSQQTASIGASVIAAHRSLVKELLTGLPRGNSPLPGREPDGDGRLRRRALAAVDETPPELRTGISARAQRRRRR